MYRWFSLKAFFSNFTLFGFKNKLLKKYFLFTGKNWVGIELFEFDLETGTELVNTNFVSQFHLVQSTKLADIAISP